MDNKAILRAWICHRHDTKAKEERGEIVQCAFFFPFFFFLTSGGGEGEKES